MVKDEHISRYIGILANRFRRELDALSFRGEYSGSEGKALHFILAHADSDLFQKDLEEEFGMRPSFLFQKDLEEEFGMRPSSASALVKKMEQDGLITRESVPYDGRLKKIVPSEKALRHKEHVLRDVQALEMRLLDGISPEQQKEWLKITKQMIENL